MFAIKERALIYVLSASISATGATAYTAVSSESAEQQHSVTYKAARVLSNDQNKVNTEEAKLVYESDGINISTLTNTSEIDYDGLYMDGSGGDTDSELMTTEQISAKLSNLEAVYPTGTVWTNDTYYKCKGEGYAAGGFGCAAFAYMLSDSLYNDTEYYKLEDLDRLQPYDVVELLYGRHTVFVLDVNDDDTITVAEANINDGVRWGGRYPIHDITGILKRY
jgi:hypothetical protein